MKKHVMFAAGAALFGICLVLGCLVGQHAGNSAETSSKNSSAKSPVYWYEKNVKKEAFIKTDEIAVLTDKNKTPPFDRALLERCLGPDTGLRVKERTDTLIFLETPHPMSLDTLKKRLAALDETGLFKGASPVFYLSDSGKPADRFVMTGKIIIQFPKDYSAKKIAEIEMHYNIKKIKIFQFAANTFLYRIDNAIEALDKANTIYESGVSVYAYPDRFRYRSTRP